MSKLTKGFTLFEIIISLTILTIISSGLASVFSTSLSGIPSAEENRLAFLYAQREMEKIVNTSFANISAENFPVVPTTYPDDNRFKYEIAVVEEAPTSQDLKSVRIRFYIGSSAQIAAELFNYIFATTTAILEDFEINGELTPPFNWTSFPGGQWNVVNFPIGNRCYQYNHRLQEGTAYPNWPGANNYSVEYKLWINRSSGETSETFSRAYLGGRCALTSSGATQVGDGYYVRVEINHSLTRVSLLRRVNGVYTPSFIGSIITFSTSLFNQWLYIKLDMKGNQISYHFGNSYPPPLRFTTTDNTRSTGGIFIRALNNLGTREVRFDDIKIEY